MYSYIIAVISSVLMAVGTFYALQKTPVDFYMEVEINLKLEEVYDIAKNPGYLIHLHHLVPEVEISNYTASDNEEKWEFLVTENLQHIGNHTFPAVTRANKHTKGIRIQSAPMFGLMFVDVNYTLREKEVLNTDETEPASPVTVFKEETTLYVPWIIENYCKRILTDTHTHFLENLKMVLEESLHLKWDITEKESK